MRCRVRINKVSALIRIFRNFFSYASNGREVKLIFAREVNRRIITPFFVIGGIISWKNMSIIMVSVE